MTKPKWTVTCQLCGREISGGRSRLFFGSVGGQAGTYRTCAESDDKCRQIQWQRKHQAS